MRPRCRLSESRRTTPHLAQGAARHGIGTLRARSDRLRLRLRGLTVRQAGRLLREHFGDLLIAENILRPTGSRAHGIWVALDAAGEELAPIRIVIRQGGREGSVACCRSGLLRIASREFCSARSTSAMCGRAGRSSRGTSAEAARLIDEGTVQAGDSVTTSSPEGALLWAAYATPVLGLHGQTWVAADTAADPRFALPVQRADDSDAPGGITFCSSPLPSCKS